MRIVIKFVLFFSILYLFSCADESENGSIAARAIWPDDGSSRSFTQNVAIPPGVVTMRAVVSGPGMANIQRDFNVTARSGTIDNVPAGQNRMLTLQALDNGNGVLFQGSATELTVTPNAVTMAPPISMSPSNNVPYVLTVTGNSQVLELDGVETFSVMLNSQPDGNVVVNVTSSDTGEALLSKLAVPGPGNTVPAETISLNFDAGNWDQPQVVSVHGQQDFVKDGNQPITIQMGIGAGTTDTTGYAQLTAAQVPDVSMLVVDADQPGVSVLPQTTTFSENGGTGAFQVVLNSIPDGDVAIGINSGDPLKTTVSSELLTFTPGNWDIPQTVNLTGVNDDIADGTDTVVINVSVDAGNTADTTGYALLTDIQVNDVSVNVTDDDRAGVTVSPTARTVAENGGTAVFTVVLNSQPNGTVSLDLGTSNAAKAKISTVSAPSNTLVVTFNDQNWFQPREITITGQDNNFVDGSVSALITVNINNGGTSDTTGYDLLADNQVNDVSVTITDNEARVLHVATGGADGNNGTATAPKQTINAAINYLKSLTPAASGTVKVASGTYNVTSGTSQVKLLPGISVFGGYNSTFTARTLRTSIIKDNAASGGTQSNPNRAVEAIFPDATTTVFDGFQVIGGGGTASAGMFVNAVLTISNNRIEGGTASSRTMGIRAVSRDAFIFNNIILGGNSTTAESYGVTVETNSVRIYNNTISGGDVTNKCRIAVYLETQTTTTPAIDNNILFAQTTGTSTCKWGIYERSITPGKPTSVRNNVFFNLDTLYEDLSDGGSYIHHKVVVDMETFIGGEGVNTGGNILVDPALDANFRYTPLSPNAATAGALNYSALFTTDADLTTRTLPWSIGAFERN